MRPYPTVTTLRTLGLVSAVLLSACATPKQEAGYVQYAAMTAARDFNIGVRPIPGQLQALSNPYGAAPFPGCEGLHREAQDLQRAIERNDKRRVGFRRDSSTTEGRWGNLRDAGVASAATMFTPYRTVVRQVSGAAAYEQQALQADQRARTRLGYLVGQGQAYGCPGFGAPSSYRHPGRR